jgi:hypothetical protein
MDDNIIYIRRKQIISAGIVYLLSENFEGTGYENVGWTETGTPDEDYTATVLEGSQSLFLDASGSANQHANSPTVADQTEIWVYFLFRPVTFVSAGNANVIEIRNNTTTLFTMQVSSTGTLRLAGSVNSLPTVGTMSVGTTYHVWLRYVVGTGANAIYSGGFSTDGIRPISGNNFTQATTGTETNTANNVRLLATGSNLTQWIFDKIRISATIIGDNP